eukprot:11597_1
MKLLSNEIDAISMLNCKIYTPALEFVGKLLAYNETITQCVLDVGYLDCIEPYMNHSSSQTRREMMQSLSNIFSGNQEQIQSILSKEKLMKTIINCSLTDKKCVRIEAIMCILNALTHAIPTQKQQLAKYGAINALCNILNPNHILHDPTVILIIEGLEDFLKTFENTKYTNPFALQIEECKGLDYLRQRFIDESLAQTTRNTIHNLINKYWDEKQHKSTPVSCVSIIIMAGTIN